MDSATLTDLYRTTKAAVAQSPTGRDSQMRSPQQAATKALRDAGLTFEQAVEMAWVIETGKPAPRWLDEMGNQTPAAIAYDRGFERHHHGE